MNNNSKYDPRKISNFVKGLPRGEQRMEILLQGINLADREQDHFYRLFFRYDYALEATFHDDPPKAIPIAMEFSKIFEEHPNVLGADYAGELYVMIMQFAVDPMIFLPQVPQAQWDQMLDQYLNLCERFDVGMGSYYNQKSLSYFHRNPKKAKELFEKSLECPEDSLTDCHACQRSYGAKLSLELGDVEGANNYVEPLEIGEIGHCDDTPQKYAIAYLEYYLDNNNLEEAEKQADILYKKGFVDRGDLSYIGNVMACYSQTNMDKALPLFEKHLGWTIDLWDKSKQFDFYKGAYVLFKELEKSMESVKLNLPREFKEFREDGNYNVAELKELFYKKSEEIGKLFDTRNGSDWFKNKLARVK